MMILGLSLLGSAAALGGCTAIPPPEPVGKRTSHVPPGGDFFVFDRAPRIISRVDPVYPPRALEHRIEGRVTMKVTVATDGSVARAKVVHSDHAILDKAALATVRQWRFKPGEMKGRVVPTTIIVPLEFDLPK